MPFDKVEASYPIHPSVVTYVNDSQKAIQKGQDRSDFIFLILHDRLTQIVTGGIILVFLTFWGGLTYFLKKKNGGNPPGSQTVVIPTETFTPPIQSPSQTKSA